MVADSETAYRVQGLSVDLTKDQVQSCIARTLEVDNSAFQLKSLTHHPIRHDQLVATITFSSIPKLLEDERESNIPLPREYMTRERSDQHITFDKHFEDFTPFHISEETDCDMDIIALSGLNGHAFGSFKSKGGPYMWVRDSLPHDFLNARVFIYGYDTRDPSIQNVNDLAHTLLYRLRNLRSVNASSSPRKLVFIGHSLGGLIVKTAMTLMEKSANETDKENLASTTGVLLFGVPSYGMHIDSLIPMMDESATYSLVYPLHNVNSPHLETLDSSFKSVRSTNAFKIFHYYETRESPTPVQDEKTRLWTMSGPPKLFVSKQSATHGLNPDRDEQIPVNRGHSDLVKFAGNSDPVYYDILARLSSSRHRLSTSEKECLQSLSFKEQDFRENMEEIEAAKGTCDWIFNCEPYRAWKARDSSLLTILGPPGSGKSTLMRHVVEKMKHDSGKEDLVLAFFIYGGGSDIQKSPIGMYRYLLHQVLPRFPRELASLTKVYLELKGSRQGNWTWIEKDLSKCFHEVIRTSITGKGPQLTLFVDALDEMGERLAERVIHEFKAITHDQERVCVANLHDSRVTRRFRICFSSRYYPILMEQDKQSIYVERSNKCDVEAVVECHRSLDCFSSSEKEAIKNLIMKRADGILQWVSLVLQEAQRMKARRHRFKTILEEMNSVPADLKGLYKRLLCTELGSKPRKHQTTKLFQWILFAKRPLSYFEVRDALMIDAKTKDASHSNLKADGYHLEDMHIVVRNISRGLADVADSGTVILIHQSVREYLQEGGLATFSNEAPELVPLRAHFQISYSCFNYLYLSDVQEIAKSKNRSSDGDFHLLDYAGRFLMGHYMNYDLCKTNTELQNILDTPPCIQNTTDGTIFRDLPPLFSCRRRSKYQTWRLSVNSGHLKFRTEITPLPLRSMLKY